MSKLLSVASVVALVCALGCSKKDKNNSKNKANDKTGAKTKSKGSGFTAETYKQMATTKIDGYQLDKGAMANKSMVRVGYKGTKANAAGYIPYATVMVMKCPIRCMDLSVDKVKANQNLKSALPKVHKDNPKLVWEVDPIDFGGGKKGVSIYSRSYIKTGKGGTAAAHGLKAIYHNGTYMIQIEVVPRGAKGFKMPSSDEEQKAQMSKADMVATAKAIFAGFAKYF